MLSNNPIHKQQSSQQQGVESEILQTRLQNLYGDVCNIIDAGRLYGIWCLFLTILLVDFRNCK